MDRAQPTPIELAIVLIAPAPGVNEISTAAPSSANHRDQAMRGF